MANDSGVNTSEVQEALNDPALTDEERRYLERVLENRGVRKASVSSHEIVDGNPEGYPKRTVEQQKDLADGRPHEPVSGEDLGVRGAGAVAAAGDDDAKKSSSKK